MAGTWMSIVEGFGGTRVRNGQLHFAPKIPKQWDAYAFKLNFRGQILKVSISHNQASFIVDVGEPLAIVVNGKEVLVDPKNETKITFN